jgi:acyl-CoA dehydrogenase
MPRWHPEFSHKDDAFVFNQGPTKGLGSVQFHDYKPVFEANKGLPNVATFMQQTEIFKAMLDAAGPDKTQDMDPDIINQTRSSFALSCLLFAAGVQCPVYRF